MEAVLTDELNPNPAPDPKKEELKREAEALLNHPTPEIIESRPPHEVKDPNRIKQWNWGAFFLPLIWGIFNRCPIALFWFVPVLGPIVIPWILGWKGNVWAWENKEWDSPATFHRTQRVWAVVGGVVFIPQLFFLVWMGITGTMPQLPGLQGKFAFDVKLPGMKANFQELLRNEVLANLTQDGEIAGEFGTPVTLGRTLRSSRRQEETTQKMAAEIEVQGRNKSAVAYAEATLDTGVVVLDKLIIYFQDPPRKVWRVPYLPDKK